MKTQALPSLATLPPAQSAPPGNGHLAGKAGSPLLGLQNR
jgi:hypothetical protein